MHSIATTRRYELFIVLAAAAAYVIRRLFQMARNFNFDIRSAQNAGVSNAKILRDLASFDYNQNVIFPTLAGAMLFMGAWYVFHYHAFPRIKEEVYDSQTKWLTGISVCLTSASISLYSFLSREIVSQPTVDGHQVGFQVLSMNIGNLFFSTCIALLVLCSYEAFAQVYYRTIELYQQKGESRYRTAQYILAAIAGGFLILWIFVGRIANVVIVSQRIIHVQSFFIILLSFLFHFVFYKKWLPYLVKFRFDTSQGFLRIIGILCIYTVVNLLLLFIWGRSIGGEFYNFSLLWLLPTAIGLVTAVVRRSLFTVNNQLQTQVLRKTTELDTLRSQVNPHFLFNALNTLYSVALKESSEKTADGIQKLGDMMRFMLHENNQERIPLRKEIEYLHNFLDLQRTRLDEGHEIEIRVNIQEPERERYLAPMLLNPFVENAFKHGISLRQPSWVYITLALDATKLYFKVHNSLHPKTGEDPEKNKPGIGLDNVRKRLDLLYPDRHTLGIQATESDYFRIIGFGNRITRMSLSAIAIDDEPRALEVIQMLAAKVPFVALSATFTDAFEAIPYLQEHKTDLLFLDIKMPDISGIEFLDCLREAPMVIFSTAYSEYAVQGFELNAVDYLLKPYSLARFAQACNKALEFKQRGQATPATTEPSAPFIFVKTGYEQEKVWVKDLCYLEAEGNYVNYVLPDRQLLSRQSLADALRALPEPQFVRIHRSFAVAVAKVQKISRYAVWVGDREIPVGVSYEGKMEEVKILLR